MKQHNAANDEIREFASLFAVGALSAEEAAAFHEHVKTCQVCAGEVRAFRETAGWLLFGSEGITPPPRLRERLLARIQQESQAGIRVVRATDGEWKPLMPGIVAKRLNQEGADGNIALLVRMEAGAKYPPHSHADVEHCYVLEGQLHFGDLVLNPGDYQCASASTTHRDSHTVNGCTVLIVASQKNTMLPWTL